MITKRTHCLFVLVLIFLLTGCVRYYWRKFVPSDTNIPRIHGWEVAEIQFQVSNGAAEKVTSGDTLYWIGLDLRHPFEGSRKDYVDRSPTYERYDHVKFEIESASVKYLDTGYEKQFNLQFDELYDHWDKGIVRVFSLGGVSIPQGIQNIQLNLTIIIKQSDQDIEGRREKLVINMHKYEKVRWGPYIPMQ